MHQFDQAVSPERVSQLDSYDLSRVLRATSRIRRVVPIGDENVLRIRGVCRDDVSRQVFVGRVG